MGLITQSIRTWDEMKSAFFQRYLDYFTPINRKDEEFTMMKIEDENLEYLIERFNYNIKRAKMEHLDQDILNYLFLKSIRD